MKSIIKFSATLATALAVTLPFALMACTESNPTIEPNGVDQSKFETLCTAENEGKVEAIREYEEGHATASDRFGHPEYYRCESGSWVKRDWTATCDTEGIQVGDACIQTHVSPYGEYYLSLYTYADNGNWTPVECDTASGEWVKKLTVDTDRKTVYYQCTYSYGRRGWHKIDELEYTCFTNSTEHSNDTCVFEHDGVTQAYLHTWPNSFVLPQYWEKMDFDPVLGYCSLFDYQKYGVRDEKLYYCGKNKWVETDLIPRQYIDPRKKGLTDEEFDVLDLPKEASIGDFAGGLLEVCFYNDVEVCVPQRIYQYDKNGSWKLYVSYRLVKNDGWDLYAYYRHDENGLWQLYEGRDEEKIQCTSENEGVETVVLPKVHIYPTRNYPCVDKCMDAIDSRFERGYVYQCVSEKKVLKEYAFERIATPKPSQLTLNTTLYFGSQGEYGKKDGKYYYCEATNCLNPEDWEKVNFIPRQYTDPRKEGLTDEEYDVLDLPKEASVGDRAAGLLELCMYNYPLTIGGWSIGFIQEKYNICFSQNFYRYHEDGSWALETEDELKNDARNQPGAATLLPDCDSEKEGMDIEDIGSKPNRILHCEAGQLSVTKYVLNQYEKVVD